MDMIMEVHTCNVARDTKYVTLPGVGVLIVLVVDVLNTQPKAKNTKHTLVSTLASCTYAHSPPQHILIGDLIFVTYRTAVGPPERFNEAGHGGAGEEVEES